MITRANHKITAPAGLAMAGTAKRKLSKMLRLPVKATACVETVLRPPI